MDLAIYINEILGLQGGVNLPGVGYFVQKRVNGHYNEQENKFYPPHHEVIFDPVPREDDDGLAAYISKKKNISPASAKYFIEKYTTSLKQQASEQKVDITGLGSLYYEYSALAFKADKARAENDPAFYGFAPVKTSKASGQVAVTEAASVAKTQPQVNVHPVAEVPPVMDEEPEVVTAKTASEPVVAEDEETALTETAVDTRTFLPQQPEEEEVPDHRRRNIMIVILLIVIIALLCFGIAYQYNPGLFGKPERVDTTVIIKRTTKPVPVKAAPATDSAVKTAIPQANNLPVDTFGFKHYDILGGAFKSLPKVNAQMKTYESLGLKPHLLQHGTGKYYKITLGTFFNKSDAQKADDSILNIKGINKNFIYIQPFIPIKK